MMLPEIERQGITHFSEADKGDMHEESIYR
jgi:hypothetical protein